MNLHEAICVEIHSVIDALAGADIVSPSYVAREVQSRYRGEGLEPHIEYASLEHLKQMARRVLSARYDAESDESEALQGELFSGHLQQRYPVPHKRGDDPIYKLLGTLTADDVAWNVHQLRKSANARMLHADALEAWGQTRTEVA